MRQTQANVDKSVKNVKFCSYVAYLIAYGAIWLEKILQCNKIQVRPLFRQTVELKQMKICNFKNQNSTEKMKTFLFDRKY